MLLALIKHTFNQAFILQVLQFDGVSLSGRQQVVIAVNVLRVVFQLTDGLPLTVTDFLFLYILSLVRHWDPPVKMVGNAGHYRRNTAQRLHFGQASLRRWVRVVHKVYFYHQDLIIARAILATLFIR